MACVATWSFGLDAVKVASGSIAAGEDCVEVLEKAINGEDIRGHTHNLGCVFVFLVDDHYHFTYSQLDIPLYCNSCPDEGVVEIEAI